MRAGWALLASGCLLLVDPFEDACIDEDCPGLFRCADAQSCVWLCSSDGECKDGAICSYGACEEPCLDEDCPEHLVCEPILNECRDHCVLDEHCTDGRRCCGSLEVFDGLCSETGTCFR